MVYSTHCSLSCNLILTKLPATKEISSDFDWVLDEHKGLGENDFLSKSAPYKERHM